MISNKRLKEIINKADMWAGEHSSEFYECFVNALRLTEGEADELGIQLPVELPDEVVVELSELDCSLNDEEEIMDAVVDFLTDEFGYCIRECDISLVDEGLAKVTNIDWDTED